MGKDAELLANYLLREYDNMVLEVIQEIICWFDVVAIVENNSHFSVMVRTIIKPEKNSLTIKLPDNFVGKVIEVIAFEIKQISNDKTATLEKKKRIEAINKALNKHRVDLSDFKYPYLS